MYLSEKDIDNRVKEHLDYVLLNNPDYDWFVIGAVGSMNYNLMTEYSDVDTKMIIVPNFKDMIFKTKQVNRSIAVPADYKEYVDIKDAREYFRVFKKMNINFVELLFTDYWIANPKYNDIWFTLRNNAEDLARLNPCKTVTTVKGMAYSKYKSMEKRRKKTYTENDAYDDNKDLAHLLRLSVFMKYYTEKKSYKECICPSDYFTNWIRGCKNGNWFLSPEQKIEYGKRYFDIIEENANDFLNTYTITKNNEEIEKILDNCLYELIERKIRGEINE